MGLMIICVLAAVVVYYLIRPAFTKSTPATFLIEYYPLSDRYYVKYKGCYLEKDNYTGIISARREDMFFADAFRSQESAEKAINLFKQQNFKENIIVTKVN